MADYTSGSWWSKWLDDHGRDSEENAAFDGFLITKGISQDADVATLEQAYADFQQFMLTSRQTPSADPGPSAEEVGVQEPVNPVSHVADPHMEKPEGAATGPHEEGEGLPETMPTPLAGGTGAPGQPPRPGEEPPQPPRPGEPVPPTPPLPHPPAPEEPEDEGKEPGQRGRRGR